MNILTVDPGQMTGCAVSFDGAVEASQMPGDEFVDWFTAAHMTFQLVISERFTISQRTVRSSRGDENWSIEQIGWMRHTRRRAGMPFELQGASDAMSFCDNARLRRLGWYQRGRDHANDALRHLLLAMTKHDRATFEKLVPLIAPS